MTERCWACNCPRRLTIHHVVPLDLGGKDVYSNMMRLCQPCHSIVHWKGGSIRSLPSYYAMLQSKREIPTEQPDFRKLVRFARMARRIENPRALLRLDQLVSVVLRLERLESSPRTVLQDVFGTNRVPDDPFDNTLQITATQ